jgi:hypothetical protein
VSLQSGQGLLRRVEIKDFDMACSVEGMNRAPQGVEEVATKINGIEMLNRHFFAD